MNSSFSEAFLQRIGSYKNDKYTFLPLDRNEITVGRSRQNHIFIPDLLLSRKHVVFRFTKNQWTVENVGMNGVVLNHTLLPPNQQIPIHDMNTVEFGNTSKYVYVFRVSSELGSEEPPAKKKRDTFPNYAQLKDLSENKEKVVSGEQISDNFLQTLKLEKLHEDFENSKIQLNLHLARIESLERKFAQGHMEKCEFQKKEFDEKCISNYLQEYQTKMKETEEMIAFASKNKQMLVEHKEFIVQQIVKGMDTLQERLKEETTLRKGVERELWETRRKVEEEISQLQRKRSEDKERYSLIREELIDCEVQLQAKDKEIDEIQSRSAIGLEIYEALKMLRENQVTEGVLQLPNGWIVDVEIADQDRGMINSFDEFTNLANEKRFHVHTE